MTKIAHLAMAPILVTSLVLMLGIASCSSSTSQLHYRTSDTPVTELTGFAFAAARLLSPSGPVTVRVTGIRASRLALLVKELPAVAESQISCVEPPGLMYKLAFSAGSIAPSKAVVEGYSCDAAVTVKADGKTSWRRDANCALIKAVSLALPGRAKATRSLDVGCGSQPTTHFPLMTAP
jgi:hypothetical protein